MATQVNPFSKVNNDTGFGSNPNSYGGRFVNRDGSFNLRKVGRPYWDRFTTFQLLLSLPAWKFVVVLVLFFITANLLYTALYLMAGTDQLQGMIAHTAWQKFKEVYFFSTETFTTVGYGRVNPVGDGANLIASFEAMSGFLSFAIATGLIYGRFAKPKSYLIFSDDALISPYRDKTALMFRFVSFKENHVLTDVEIRVTTAMIVAENGRSEYKFYNLSLERSKVDSLPMNWTVVHALDEESPFYGMTLEDMRAADLEIYVLIRGFDDVYSNFVLRRTSYTYNEIKFNRKFLPMYHESSDGRTTIVELQKLNESMAL